MDKLTPKEEARVGAALALGERPTAREMTDFEHKLVSLLDRIEIEEDPTLARQRHALAEEQGYTVVITDERISGEIN